MPVQHLGKEISVTLSEGDVRLPQRFTLAGKEYRVADVLSTWQDHGYSGLPTTRRGWQGSSQRQFYRLRTSEGEVFEIYVETPAGRRGRPQKARWYAQRRLTAAAEEAGEANPPMSEDGRVHRPPDPGSL